jgi:glycine/D-amino acid oxidase-like deaminating enzyme
LSVSTGRIGLWSTPITSAREFSGSSATEKRDLREGMPVWLVAPGLGVACTPLTGSMKVDVVVAGAGITGALVALATSEKGLSTLVIDRRPPARGSTAASTALLQWEIDTPLIRLADKIGLARAGAAWRRSFSAVQALASLVHRHEIDCRFTPRQALYLPGNELDPAALLEEGRMRTSIGLPSLALSALELKARTGIDRPCALLSSQVADVDPVLMAEGVLAEARRAGCRIHAPCELAEVVPRLDKVEMGTRDGFEIEAKHLVFATGYELADGVPVHGHRRTSTWALATPPQHEALWAKRDLIWEAATPYLYVRTTADGRVVVGGEDEDFDNEETRDALLPAKTAALQEKLKALLPQIDVTADYAWAGTFGESDTGLPSIGRVPGMPNCHAVLGYGGNGITFGMIAAQVIAAQLLGESDADTELFAFSER